MWLKLLTFSHGGQFLRCKKFSLHFHSQLGSHRLYFILENRMNMAQQIFISPFYFMFSEINLFEKSQRKICPVHPPLYCELKKIPSSKIFLNFLVLFVLLFFWMWEQQQLTAGSHYAGFTTRSVAFTFEQRWREKPTFGLYLSKHVSALI